MIGISGHTITFYFSIYFSVQPVSSPWYETKMRPHQKIPAQSSRSGEKTFLGGRNSRLGELSKVFRISGEFIRGFRMFHKCGPAVTVFGSARFEENHQYYEKARSIGRGLATQGWTVITGGGPGIMEAANRGAFEAGGQSYGANIILPHN